MTDAGQASTVDAIHERTNYATPSGPVNLPSFYSNAYTGGNGTCVLHKDANYQIDTDPAFNAKNWEKIEPVR